MVSLTKKQSFSSEDKEEEINYLIDIKFEDSTTETSSANDESNGSTYQYDLKLLSNTTSENLENQTPLEKTQREVPGLCSFLLRINLQRLPCTCSNHGLLFTICSMIILFLGLFVLLVIARGETDTKKVTLTPISITNSTHSIHSSMNSTISEEPLSFYDSQISNSTQTNPSSFIGTFLVSPPSFPPTPNTEMDDKYTSLPSGWSVLMNDHSTSFPSSTLPPTNSQASPSLHDLKIPSNQPLTLHPSVPFSRQGRTLLPSDPLTSLPSSVLVPPSSLPSSVAPTINIVPHQVLTTLHLNLSSLPYQSETPTQMPSDQPFTHTPSITSQHTRMTQLPGDPLTSLPSSSPISPSLYPSLAPTIITLSEHALPALQPSNSSLLYQSETSTQTAASYQPFTHTPSITSQRTRITQVPSDPLTSLPSSSPDLHPLLSPSLAPTIITLYGHASPALQPSNSSLLYQSETSIQIASDQPSTPKPSITSERTIMTQLPSDSLTSLPSNFPKLATLSPSAAPTISPSHMHSLLPSALMDRNIEWKKIGSDIDGSGEYEFIGHSVILSHSGDRTVVAGYATLRVYDLIVNESENSRWYLSVDLSRYVDNGVSSVSLSKDGRVLVAGQPSGSSEEAQKSGIVQIFFQSLHTETDWILYKTPFYGDEQGDLFGQSVAVENTESGGLRIAIGAPGGNYVKIMDFIGNSAFELSRYLQKDGGFGRSISMTGNGDLIAIGSVDESNPRGSVWIYDIAKSLYIQTINGKFIDDVLKPDWFGWSVSFSDDGSTLVIGAYEGDYVHVLRYYPSSFSWKQVGRSISGKRESFFGISVSVSSDGKIVAIGSSLGENTDGKSSGNTQIYYIDDEDFRNIGNIDGEFDMDWSGVCVSLSSDGSRVAIGASNNDGGGEESGHVSVYRINTGKES